MDSKTFAQKKAGRGPSGPTGYLSGLFWQHVGRIVGRTALVVLSAPQWCGRVRSRPLRFKEGGHLVERARRPPGMSGTEVTALDVYRSPLCDQEISVCAGWSLELTIAGA